MNSQLQRTQIYLPKDLRAQIDRARRLRGESLAEYLRRAAEERLKKEQKKKADLKKLADEVIGSIKPGEGGWGDVDLQQWRKERQEEDEYAMKRLDKAVEASSTTKTSKRRKNKLYDAILKVNDKVSS